MPLCDKNLLIWSKLIEARLESHTVALDDMFHVAMSSGPVIYLKLIPHTLHCCCKHSPGRHVYNHPNSKQRFSFSRTKSLWQMFYIIFRTDCCTYLFMLHLIAATKYSRNPKYVFCRILRQTASLETGVSIMNEHQRLKRWGEVHHFVKEMTAMRTQFSLHVVCLQISISFIYKCSIPDPLWKNLLHSITRIS